MSLDHPITSVWLPKSADRLQLYSNTTPNGVKVSIALEELGIPYDAHLLSFEVLSKPEFRALNPNGKIPAILDPNGPGGRPMALFESGAILIYLAEKTGKLLPSDREQRMQAIQWLMFQMGGVGPMFGQLGYFAAFGGKAIEDPRPRDRYIAEAKRLLSVINDQLADRTWIAGEYSIADIAIAPWLEELSYQGTKELVGWASFDRVVDYHQRFMARPAVIRGMNVPET